MCIPCIRCYLASESKLWTEVILGNNSTQKFLRAIFIERQEIFKKSKPALLLLFGQHSRDLISWDIPKIYVKID